MSTTLHTITALVHNESGTLNRLASLFRRRMFSLSSLNAGDCEQEGFSRVTMVVEGDNNLLRQCVRQLDKLVDVVEVEDLPQAASVQRELAFFEVSATPENRRQVLDIADAMRCEVVHMEPETITLQVSAEPTRIDHINTLLAPFGIKQLVRSGLVAIRVRN
ncbi:MAG: acetolactate synthase small subunit [Armatimonadota bacterium]